VFLIFTNLIDIEQIQIMLFVAFVLFFFFLMTSRGSFYIINVNLLCCDANILPQTMACPFIIFFHTTPCVLPYLAALILPVLAVKRVMGGSLSPPFSSTLLVGCSVVTCEGSHQHHDQN
jgi:hypothetical protein